jgi:hypothetical protein
MNIDAILKDLPHFEKFSSVKELLDLAEDLRRDSRFEVQVAGYSGNNIPIHHVRFGSGKVKALIVGFPHCMEPIGGLTVFSLLTLLRRSQRDLLAADVEWHIVPCVDPDGARLNEDWTQKRFAFDSYMRGYYVQESRNQVDMSFPVSYKRMVWNEPSREARVLQGLLDRILPDFFFSLHNTRTGGAFYYVTRDIGRRYYDRFYRLLEAEGMSVQKRGQWKEVVPQYAEGVFETVSYRKLYDYFERIMPAPQSADLLQYGVSSWEYLAQIKPSALSFTAEMGYVMHPAADSEKDTGQSWRRFKLKMDAENKYLATLLLEEWETVKDDLDPESPFYRTVVGGWVLPQKEKLVEGGLPVARYPTREILFSPNYSGTMREADLINECMVDGGFFYHLFAYQLVRLLKASRRTPAVEQAIARLDEAFDEAHEELAKHIDFSEFQIFECDTLARVQLGSGLIALDSILDLQQR